MGRRGPIYAGADYAAVFDSGVFHVIVNNYRLISRFSTPLLFTYYFPRRYYLLITLHANISTYLLLNNKTAKENFLIEKNKT